MSTTARHRSQSKARLLIVDHHPITRHGLVQLIDREPDLMVCDQAADTPAALESIQTHQPDLVILDISLKRGGGFECLKILKAHCDGLPILVLSGHEEIVLVERAMRAGARGYVMKHEETDTILRAIRQLLQGRAYLSERLQGRLSGKEAEPGALSAFECVQRLSDREMEVFQLIGRGKRTREIAEILKLSVKTIETHRVHIMHKLHCEGAVELMRRAYEWFCAEP